MMRSAARLHPDKARHHVGEPRLDLSTRPFLAQCDRAPLIEANQVERVLSDIDTNDRNSCSGFLWHGVLLIVGAPRQFAAPAGAEARPDHSDMQPTCKCMGALRPHRSHMRIEAPTGTSQG